MSLSLPAQPNRAPASRPNVTAGVAFCRSLAGLRAIARPDVELAIWRRRSPAPLATWLEGLDAAGLPDLWRVLVPRDLPRALVPLLDEVGMPAGAARDLLVADMARLARAFARLAGTPLVDVRLERVRHDACWKFHRDCVEARLVVTYHGPGTEWVAPEHAAAALRDQKQFSGPIERLGVHDVALFKGSCAAPASGIVHRSPPIAGSGLTRLLLCFNKPSGVSPQPWVDPTSR